MPQGSMAVNNKFGDAKNGALDFGLMCIKRRYEVGVIVFSSKASATSPTAEPNRSPRQEIDELQIHGRRDVFWRQPSITHSNINLLMSLS